MIRRSIWAGQVHYCEL